MAQQPKPNDPNPAIFFEKVVPLCHGMTRLRIGKTGLGCSYKRLKAWTRRGLINKKRGTNGCADKIFLEWMFIGHQRYTSEEAFWRFQQRLNGIKVRSPVLGKKLKAGN